MIDGKRETRARPPAPDAEAAPTADVVLLGYRNDLARERVLAALARTSFSADLLHPPSRESQLPHVLASELSAERARRLGADIERLGGQVAIRPSGTPVQPLAHTVLTAPRRSPVRPLTLVLVALLGAAAYRWRATPQVNGGLRSPSLAPVALEALSGMEIGSDNGAGQLNQQGVELANQGRYAEAYAALRKALQIVPGHPIVSRNMQVVLTNWGVRDLDEGEPRAAIDHFGEASTFGSRPEVLSGLGIANLRAKEFRTAISYLTDALRRGATDAGVLLALAEAYEAIDDRERALDFFTRARDAGLRAAQLEEHITKLSREIDAEWDFVARDSRHFQVRFDAGEDLDVAHTVLESLEAAYETVGRKLDYYPTAKTEAVLYPNQDFHDITQTPEWASGVFDGRIKLPVRGLMAGDPTLDRYVRHEYTHSLIAALGGGRVPVWLNEGIAMWAEEEIAGDRRDWARQQLSGRELLALDSLRGPFTRLPEDYAQQAYAQSYLTVLYLVDNYDARRIPRLLAAAGKDRDFTSAFADVYPIDLTKLEDGVTAVLTR